MADNPTTPSVDYIISGSTLDDIANAINAKTGGSTAMTPAQMVTAIGNIPSGGGETVYTNYYGKAYPENVVALVTNRGFFASLYRECEHLKTVRFYNDDFTASMTEDLGTGLMFYGCTDLESVVLEIITRSSRDTYRDCPNLKTVQLGRIGQAVTAIDLYAFKNDTQSNLMITLYVADDATLPLTGSPFGATNATIIYRSATTGEVITV